MLRSKQPSRNESPLGKTVSLLLVGLIAISVAGFRFPDQTAATEAGSSPPNPGMASNLRFVPGNADSVIVMRPAQILKKDLMRKAYDSFTSDDKSKNVFDGMLMDMFAVKAESLNQLTGVFVDMTSNSSPILIWIAQSQGAAWWADGDIARNMQDKLVASPAFSFRHHKIYASEKPMLTGCYIVADERTLIFVTGPHNDPKRLERAVKSAIRSASGHNHDWAEAWEAVSHNDISAVAMSNALDLIQSDISRDANNLAGVILKPMMDAADFMVSALNYDRGKTEIVTAVHCADGTDVGEVKDAAIGLKAFAKSLLAITKQSLANRETAPWAGKLAYELPAALLQALTIETDANRVVLKTSLAQEQEGMLEALVPIIASSRAAATRVESANKVRQLMLGLLNYESAHQHFPPPVLVSNSGKKYSWRVAILPYIEEQALYDNYRFDEEWNSEHNRKVTAKIPAAFQHPLAIANGSKFCSYYVITGKKTAFPSSKKGMTIQNIADGTSHTLGVVEAKKDVHWADPRDINFSDGKIDTKLGGFTPGGFNASLCDGSTHYWDEDIDESSLRLLIECSDGKLFNWNRFKQFMQH